MSIVNYTEFKMELSKQIDNIENVFVGDEFCYVFGCYKGRSTI